MFDSKAYNKKWREEHPEYFRDKKREAYQKNREKILAQNKAWRDKNKDKVNETRKAKLVDKRESHRRWRDKNRDKVRANYREYVAKNKEQVARGVRRWVLKTRYNLTPEQHAAMIAKQKGLCFICKQAPEKGLVVDHDHDSKLVRGLLCQPCNIAIGLLGDDPGRATNAGKYLRTWRKKHSSGLPLG